MTTRLTEYRSAALVASATLPLLAACGGGGGGGGGGSTPATTVPATTPLAFTDAPAASTAATVPNGTSFGTPAIADTSGASTASLTTDASGRQFLALNINTGGVAYAHTFDLSTARQSGPLVRAVEDGADVGGGTLENSLLIVDNLSFAKWGIWAHATSSLTGTTGAFAAGQATPVASMPVSGTASFTGLTVGLLNTPSGQGAVAGTAALTADFGARSVTADFTSMKAEVNNGPLTDWNSLRMTATIAPGTNRFGGTVASTSTSTLSPAALSGSGNGTFFGPQAQEAAGVWQVQGGGTTALGSFGVKR